MLFLCTLQIACFYATAVIVLNCQLGYLLAISPWNQIPLEVFRFILLKAILETVFKLPSALPEFLYMFQQPLNLTILPSALLLSIGLVVIKNIGLTHQWKWFFSLQLIEIIWILNSMNILSLHPYRRAQLRWCIWQQKPLIPVIISMNLFYKLSRLLISLLQNAKCDHKLNADKGLAKRRK